MAKNPWKKLVKKCLIKNSDESIKNLKIQSKILVFFLDVNLLLLEGNWYALLKLKSTCYDIGIDMKIYVYDVKNS